MPINRVSLSEFKKIKAMAAKKKARKASKAQETAQLAVLGGVPGPETWQGSSDSSFMGPDRLKRATGKLGTLKRVNRKERTKRLKKAGLVLWSLVVRKRDGNRCLMCGKTEYMQAHHWLFRKSHSVRLALDPANGATLCYGCHIGRIHHDGDGDFVLRLADKMTAIVGPLKVEEMRETARHSGPISLEDVELANNKLKRELEGYAK